MDNSLLGVDHKATIEYLKDLLKQVEKGKRAFVKIGLVLWLLRSDLQYGGHGRWLPFLETIGISSSQDLDNRKAAFQFMVNTGIINQGQLIKREHCLEALSLIDQNSAFVQNFLDQIDMRTVRRQKPPMKIKTGSIADLEPQLSKDMGEAKYRAQNCVLWSPEDAEKSENTLERFETEVKALRKHIKNERAGTQLEMDEILKHEIAK